MMDGVLEKHHDLNAINKMLIPQQWMVEINPLQWNEEQKIVLN